MESEAPRGKILELKTWKFLSPGMSVTVIQNGPPGYFANISITTPIVSALKNYYIRGGAWVVANFKILTDRARSAAT